MVWIPALGKTLCKAAGNIAVHVMEAATALKECMFLWEMQMLESASHN